MTTDWALIIHSSGGLKVQDQGDSMSGFWRDPLLGCTLLTSHNRRGDQVSGASFMRALIPFLRTLLSWSNHFPKAHALILSSWAIGFQHMNFRGTQTSHLKHKLFIYLFIYLFIFNYFVVVQVQLPAFTLSLFPPTPAIPISLPCFHSPPWFCPCVHYSCP